MTNNVMTAFITGGTGSGIKIDTATKKTVNPMSFILRLFKKGDTYEKSYCFRFHLQTPAMSEGTKMIQRTATKMIKSHTIHNHIVMVIYHFR